MVFILLLLVVLYLMLNNQKSLNILAQMAIDKSGLAIKYQQIEGGIFDGIKIKNFNYQDQVKADLHFKADFYALKEKIIHINTLSLSNLWIDEQFITTLTKDTNQTEQNETSNQEKPPIKRLLVDHLFLNLKDFKYQTYTIDQLNIKIDNVNYDMDKTLYATLETFIQSNITDTNISAEAFGDHFSATLEGDIHHIYFKNLLANQNISLQASPHLKLDAKGDFQTIQANVMVDNTTLHYNDIYVNPQKLQLNADYQVETKDINTQLDTVIESTPTNISLTSDVQFNLEDINNTLRYTLNSILLPQKKYLQKITGDQNVTIEKMPQIRLDAYGDLKTVEAKIDTKDGSFSLYQHNIQPKELDLNMLYKIQSGDLKADILSNIEASLGTFNLDGNLSLNHKDINNSLRVDLTANLKPEQKSQRLVIKDKNITIQKLPNFDFVLKGDSKNLNLNALVKKGEITINDYTIKPKYSELNASYSILNGDLLADMKTKAYSTAATFLLNTHTTLNSKDINNTLHYRANAQIKGEKTYQGIDLKPLGKLNIDATGSMRDMDAKIVADKLLVTAKSPDMQKIDFALDTQKIYLSKIYNKLPTPLQKSFIALKSDGSYNLKEKELKLNSELKGFKYGKKIITTTPFTLYLHKENLKVSNLHIKTDDFQLALDAVKEGEQIIANIQNREINAKANIRLEPLYVDGYVKIDSIAKLIKEIQKIYPLQIPLEVDGPLDLVASMEGKSAKVTLTSPKIAFDDGNLYDLNILGLYNPEKVLIKNFDFALKEFKPKSFNRVVNLKHDGIIVLKKGEESIDIELENLLSFKAAQNEDVTTGHLTTDNLLLAYQDYGSTKLTTKLDMYQSKTQLAVTGFIRFAETEINYESPFLDVSKDSDIIIITKESKTKKEKKDENFLKNTFLDIDVLAKDEMLYHVDAGEIAFKPDINIRKDLGYEPKITGKINVIEGQYDFADKRFQIEPGAIAFRGQQGANPLLDLYVNYDEIEDILIKIAISGDKNRPKLTFSSEPMMSKKDIFSYLLFGFSVSESEGAATSANKAAEKIFGRAIAKDLARELNLDRLDMNRNEVGGIDIKAGKKLNRKSILYYQNRSNESSMLYERKLSDKWSIETEVGKQGQGFDLFYKKGYR